jgi:hypothetical protein
MTSHIRLPKSDGDSIVRLSWLAVQVEFFGVNLREGCSIVLCSIFGHWRRGEPGPVTAMSAVVADGRPFTQPTRIA